MDRTSAGILLYCLRDGRLEVLLGHPGGPWNARKDRGHWTIPKGEVEPGEDLLAVARREFHEETGTALAAIDAEFIPLGLIRQKGGKLVWAWGCVGKIDPGLAYSNTFWSEWPPGSGRQIQVPELDRVDWFSAHEARERIKDAQAPFIDRLVAVLTERSRGSQTALPIDADPSGSQDDFTKRP